ncbi:ion channel domain-containing protein [Hirsutella rhossiliensis]|uniref:Ion channel domain-containing protein n=1 Tax=Hirsutella rhossiliensis TaxID=111463 RepID=A0A9P8MR07_9HYPO|nr:ion channel domain-containing protein [Hirsutella rhossiliensis]KAH0958586.1 ion channel domain-containing protein [Hirsutella rhossiliensis]
MDLGKPGDTIDRRDQAVESPIQSGLCRKQSELLRQPRFQNDDAHLNPSRWWFASSAFPMIAGTLGPVASAFSICALVRQWRQHYPPGTDIAKAIFVPDPPWLIIINAVQLVMALVSNAFLLLNMARRVRFSIAQPITIVGWYISAFCLLALGATAAGPLLEDLEHPVDEYVWSQAFYYGIWAAILYFVDASLMVVTFWGASSGHYSKDFNLTASQRTLMLQTIMVLMYLLLGALVFSKVEGWSYLDAVYWANVTLFTVGFGDFAASTNLGRALLFPYALIGVLSLGLVVTSIRSLILDRGRRRLDARMEEKNRRRVIRTLARKGIDEILTPLPRELSMNTAETEPDGPTPSEFERRRSEFGLMRKIQERASTRRRWLAMAISTGTWILLWLVGAAVFLKCESSYQPWTYFDSFYFCFVSLMTIGYGDRTPVSNAGKSFFVFWSLLALPTMTVLISNAGDTVIKFVRDGTIRLGNVTILPSDEGFGGNMKHVAHRLTCGRAFKEASARMRDIEQSDRVSEKPLPSSSAAKDGTSSSNEASSQSGSRLLETQSSRQGHLVATTTVDRRSLARVRDRLDNLPTGYDLRLLLISEIQNLSKHVRETEPRRYTFEEWAWYLGLIGEDERDPDTHHKAKPKEKHRQRHRHRNKHGHGKHRHQQQHQRQQQHPHQEQHESDEHLSDEQQEEHPETSPPVEQDDRFKWSWVGIRSPLMGGQEESEWLMERLMDRLQESLWAAKYEDKQDDVDPT